MGKSALFTYMGSKAVVADWIVPLMDIPHRAYIETHCGSAGILINKARVPWEMINDLDGEVINFYRQLRDNGERLAELIELTPDSRVEFELSHEPCEDEMERARRFFVRQNQGFFMNKAVVDMSWNSGYPSYAKFGFSHSTAMNRWRQRTNNLWIFVERFRDVHIECVDALQVLERFDSENTLFYVDPPYYEGSQRTEEDMYGHGGTSEQSHRDLAEVLHRSKSKIVLSGYQCELYDELYPDWDVQYKKTGMTISKEKRREGVWRNFTTQARLL